MASKIDKLQQELVKAFSSHDIASLIHVEPFARMILDKPDEAIRQILRLYNKGLDEAYTDSEGHNVRGFVEAMCSGPLETLPVNIYNAIGVAYPYLERQQRDNALAQILNIFDGLNYAIVNGEHGPGHTTGIREPLLLTDITIARALYWPGMDEGKFLLKQFGSFKDLRRNIIDETGRFRKDKVNSDFVVAYSLLRTDFCHYGSEYARVAEQGFLDRTLHGIVAMRFSHDKDQKETEERTKRLEEILPEQFHDRIEPIRLQADWVDFEKFR